MEETREQKIVRLIKEECKAYEILASIVNDIKKHEEKLKKLKRDYKMAQAVWDEKNQELHQAQEFIFQIT